MDELDQVLEIVWLKNLKFAYFHETMKINGLHTFNYHDNRFYQRRNPRRNASCLSFPKPNR